MKEAEHQRIEHERFAALGFLTDQFAQRSVRFGYVQRAITIASSNYHEILEAHAAKGVNWSAFATFVAFAVFPEYAALAAIVGEVTAFTDEGKANAANYKNTVSRLGTALKSIGRTVDMIRLTQPDTATGPKFSAANDVFKQAYDKTLEAMTIEANVLQDVINAIAADSLGDKPWTQAMAFWNAAKLQRLVAQPPAVLRNQSDDMAEMLLYDMLRQYTKQYVRMTIDDYRTDDLTKVSNSDVNVKGFDSKQRELIYKHFTQVPWKVTGTDPRPPIKDWRDLVNVWGADATFVGPDGPD